MIAVTALLLTAVVSTRGKTSVALTANHLLAVELLGESGKKQVMQDICIKKAVTFVVDNAKEASFIEGIEVYAMERLRDVVDFLSGVEYAPVETSSFVSTSTFISRTTLPNSVISQCTRYLPFSLIW